jgi:hypothetical protein
MSERLKVVANRDLPLDAGLWEETDGARRHQIFHPATLTGTVIGLRTAGANDRGPIIEGEAKSLAFP